jgi:polyketide biosynthesis enoyl-CoA hydratase PksI
MSPKVFTTRVEEGVACVQMADPEHQNRLTEELIDDLMAGLGALAADPALKAVILTGSKEVFCGGGTLEMLRKIASGAMVAKDLLLPLRLVDFPVPIIAALEGHAVGAGLGVALCCDVAVASETARYSANFTSMGFTPGLGVTSLLPALVGYGFASEMMLSAKFYKGRELKGRGLFTHIVPAAEVFGLAMDLARRFAERPRDILTMLKAELVIPRRRLLMEAMSREHLMHQICFAKPETKALLEAAYVGALPDSSGAAFGDQELGNQEERGEPPIRRGDREEPG